MITDYHEVLRETLTELVKGWKSRREEIKLAQTRWYGKPITWVQTLTTELNQLDQLITQTEDFLATLSQKEIQ